MNIRLATIEDVEALARLHGLFRDSLQRDVADCAQFKSALGEVIPHGGTRVFIALVDDEAVGYTTMQLFPSAWSASRVAVVEDLFVVEACRGRGVGRALVEAAIKEASALGCAAMSLDTNERNQASQAVYRRLGFTCERARWNGGRQIRYDLRLTNAAPGGGSTPSSNPGGSA